MSILAERGDVEPTLGFGVGSVDRVPVLAEVHPSARRPSCSPSRVGHHAEHGDELRVGGDVLPLVVASPDDVLVGGLLGRELSETVVPA
ncbi:hypothetical protein [Streptomyces sp. ADI96-02]|uniref:hypothetical protein n=1 Tax=Streptomyces sp. ADI96-02 TaxID=1522760 RepID=UPI000F553151|nr:hypothetical protein [Streptomyces sp. ADI96-02]